MPTYTATGASAVSAMIKEFYNVRQMRLMVLLRKTISRLLLTKGGGIMNYNAELGKVVFGSRHSLPGGVFTADANGNLGQTNDASTTNRFTLQTFEYQGGIRLTSAVLHDSGDKLLTNEVNAQMEAVLEQQARIINRFIVSTGNCQLCSITGAEVAYAKADAPTGFNYAIPVVDTSALALGQIVDWYGADNTLVGQVKVIGANTPTGPGSLVVNSATALSGNGAGTAYGGFYLQNTSPTMSNPVHGLGDLISDKGWFLTAGEGGFDRSLDTRVGYRSVVKDGTGNAAPTYELLEDLFDDLTMIGGEFADFDGIQRKMKKITSYFCCHPGVYRALTRSMRGMQHVMDTVEVDPGFSIKAYEGVPIVREPDVAPGSGFAFKCPDWFNLSMPTKWEPGTDGLFTRGYGTVNNEAVFRSRLQLFTDNPRNQGKITNIPNSTKAAVAYSA